MGVGEGREVCFPDHNYTVKETECSDLGEGAGGGGPFIIIWCADPIPLLDRRKKRHCQHFETFCVNESPNILLSVSQKPLQVLETTHSSLPRNSLQRQFITLLFASSGPA